jgi:hypothetical protein
MPLTRNVTWPSTSLAWEAAFVWGVEVSDPQPHSSIADRERPKQRQSEFVMRVCLWGTLLIERS